jgi:putative YjhG/YagF family dehydratase
MRNVTLTELLETGDEGMFAVQTSAEGPRGSLPLTDQMLREWPSGDLFGLSQNAGMGWSPSEMTGPQFLLLSTQGGVRAPDGTPIALGYHTGHWEVGLLVQAAARELKALGGVPFAAFCSDPCDGRSQGTTGMFDSLPYRNDAATVLRRLARSLPTRRGILGIATCDKGLPAMMMALAGLRDLPAVVVPGGASLLAREGEDAAKIQTIGARYAHGELDLLDAATLGCRACATPGGGCQFMGTAATSQVIGEALGWSLPHAALAPSGQPIWLDMAVRSARAVWMLSQKGIRTADIINEASVRNAMVVHAACGGSSNLLLHLPAIAFYAGTRRPTVDDWIDVNRRVPRLVDVLPNGPVYHTTVQMFLAGGVPEVMLKLREMDLLHLDVLTVTGQTLGENLRWWESCRRRARLRSWLCESDGVDPDHVVMDEATARRRGLTSTFCFPKGNLAPEGSVVKSTAIDRSLLDADGIYRLVGPARVFTAEREAMRSLKAQSDRPIKPGDVVILCCRGPAGAGMEETAQLTIAMKHLSWSAQVALVTDARFSGVTTGPCIGHVGPEALAGGPIGKVRDGDAIQIVIDPERLAGSIDLVGEDSRRFSPAEGAAVLAARSPRPDLAPDPNLPDDTRLWAALQRASGGTWGGCVYDVDQIVRQLEAGTRQTP